MKHIKRIIRFIFASVLIYLLYTLVFFVFVFKTTKVVESTISYKKEDLLNTADENLFATLIESPKEAMDVRLNLIEIAEESILITYYYYKEDTASIILTEALLKKADQGVKITLIIDGKTPSKKDCFKLLANHPNIKYYLYEPANLLFPHTLNNIMHDKIFIVDNKYGITGGRNVSNRFLLEENGIETQDSDILVFGDEYNPKPVAEMTQYFNDLLDSNFTKLAKAKEVKDEVQTRKKTNIEYQNYINKGIYELTYFTQQKSIKVDNASFIRSPLNRMLKEPIVAKTIFSLYDQNELMIIQSPYITSSKIMKEFFPAIKENKNITLLTNSIYDNPNFISTTGYYPIKNKLATNYNLYEYQGEGSIHGKTITIGNDISIVGSLNMDTRSFFLSTESVMIIISEEFTTRLNESINSLIELSLKVKDKNNYYSSNEVVPVKPPKIRFFFQRFTSTIHKLYDHLLVNNKTYNIKYKKRA